MSLPAPPPSATTIGSQVLYYGDVVGRREGRDDHRLGQVQGDGFPSLQELQGHSEQPYWPISRRFEVIWRNPHEVTTYDRHNQSVTDSIYLLDRPYIREGSTVLKAGCQSIEGQVVAVEPVVTLISVEHPHVLVVDIPFRRFYQENISPLNHRFVCGSKIGVLSEGNYQVTIEYQDPSDACTITIQVPGQGYDRIGLGQEIVWDASRLRAGTWRSATTTASTFMISATHAGRPGRVSSISLTSGIVKWARDIRTGEMILNSELDFGTDPVQFFTPNKHEFDLDAEYSLTFTENDHLCTLDYWETIQFGPPIGPPPAKSLRLETEIPLLRGPHRVKIHLAQNRLGVDWVLNENDRLHENVASAKIKQVEEAATVEIPQYSFVLHRFSTSETEDLIGVTKVFPGEVDLAFVNPELNTSNMLDVTWITIDPDTDEFTVDNKDTHSCYELTSVDITPIKSSILVVDSMGMTPLFASFHKILANGMIQIRDMNGDTLERWPSAIVVQSETESQGFCAYLKRQMTTTSVEEDSSSEATFDFNVQSGALTVLRECNICATVTLLPVIIEFELENELDRIRLAGSRQGFWLYSYADRKDVISVVYPGNGYYEELMFLVHLQFPETYPSVPPTLLAASGDHMTPFLYNKLQTFVTNQGPIQSLQVFLMSLKESLNPDSDDDDFRPHFYNHVNSIPVTHLYDEDVLQDEDWDQRLDEVQKVSAIHLVYRTLLTNTTDSVTTQVKGHYRRVLTSMTTRWKDWAEDEDSSEGFQQAIANVTAILNPDDQDEGDDDENGETNDTEENETSDEAPPPLVPGLPDTDIIGPNSSDDDSDDEDEKPDAEIPPEGPPMVQNPSEAEVAQNPPQEAEVARAEDPQEPEVPQNAEQTSVAQDPPQEPEVAQDPPQEPEVAQNPSPQVNDDSDDPDI